MDQGGSRSRTQEALEETAYTHGRRRNPSPRCESARRRAVCFGIFPFILSLGRSKKSAKIEGKYQPKIDGEFFSQDAQTSPSLLGEC